MARVNKYPSSFPQRITIFWSILVDFGKENLLFLSKRFYCYFINFNLVHELNEDQHLFSVIKL